MNHYKTAKQQDTFFSSCLFAQVTWQWDGGAWRWGGWACFLAAILHVWPSQRTPSGTRWRTVRACGGCRIVMWSVTPDLHAGSLCEDNRGGATVYPVILCVTEEQNLVKELVALSTRDRIQAIRDLPMSFDEKKHIRWVLTEKQLKVISFLVSVIPATELTITPLLGTIK